MIIIHLHEYKSSRHVHFLMEISTVKGTEWFVKFPKRNVFVKCAFDIYYE